MRLGQKGRRHDLRHGSGDRGDRGPARDDRAGGGELGRLVGWLPLDDTSLAFLGSIWAVGILTLLALGELVADQLPSTPSRKVPIQFGARIVTGALCGAAIGAPATCSPAGALAGIVGAVIGTYVGAASRAALASEPSAGTCPPR